MIFRNKIPHDINETTKFPFPTTRAAITEDHGNLKCCDLPHRLGLANTRECLIFLHVSGLVCFYLF